MASTLIEEVQWSSDHQVDKADERREGAERRRYKGRSITVPDMRSGIDRRAGTTAKGKVRLTITGRAMDI